MIVSKSRFAFALACAVAAVLVTFPALAQPAMTRIIVGFPPGGTIDIVARTVTEALGKELGRQVIVENKPGANGAIAGEYVSRSTPGLSTLWFTSVGAVAIAPSLYDNLPY